MNNEKNQKIKCDVESCKFNNSNDNECDLEEIKVSCNCENDNCHSNDETICDSFEEKEFDEDNFQEEYVEVEDEILDEYVLVDDIEKE